MAGRWAIAVLAIVMLAMSTHATQVEEMDRRTQPILNLDYAEGFGLFQLMRSGDDLAVQRLPTGGPEVIESQAWSGNDHVASSGIHVLGGDPPRVVWQHYDSASNARSIRAGAPGEPTVLLHTLSPPPGPGGSNYTVAFAFFDAPGPVTAWFDFASSSGVAFELWMARLESTGWEKEIIHSVPEPAQIARPFLQAAADGSPYVVYHVRNQFPDGPFAPILLRQLNGNWEQLALPNEVKEIVGAPESPRMNADLTFLAWLHDGTVTVLDQVDGTWSFGETLFQFDASEEFTLVQGLGTWTDHRGHLFAQFLTGSANRDLERQYVQYDGTEWMNVNPPQGFHWAARTWGGHDDVFFRAVDATEYWIERHRFTPGPTADFSVPVEATTRTVVSPQDLSTALDGRPISSWQWDFGGVSTLEADASHTFTEPGRYWIRLAIEDSEGGTDSAASPIDVAPIGPEACIDVAATATTGQAVPFKDCSLHPEADLGASIESYAWDFGDGTGSTSKDASHAYSSAGTYTVSLMVADEQGTTDEATKTVTVADPPPNQKPSVDFSYEPDQPVVGQEVSFTATASDGDGSIASTTWSIDGVDAGSGTSLARTFTEPGPVSVVFTATDDDGESSSVTKNVQIRAPEAPVLSLSSTQISQTAGQVFEVALTVENPNPVDVTVALASDAPEAWNASFSLAALELDAGASKDVTFTIAPPYFEGGLTLIEIRAAVGDEAAMKILRVQLQPGQAPGEETTDEEETSDDPETVQSLPDADDPRQGIPIWGWVAAGLGMLVMGGGAVVFLLRRP